MALAGDGPLGLLDETAGKGGFQKEGIGGPEQLELQLLPAKWCTSNQTVDVQGGCGCSDVAYDQ